MVRTIIMMSGMGRQNSDAKSKMQNPELIIHFRSGLEA